MGLNDRFNPLEFEDNRVLGVSLPNHILTLDSINSLKLNRSTAGYGLQLNGNDVFIAGVDIQCSALQIIGTRALGKTVTGVNSVDSLLYIIGTNYDFSTTFRGINAVVNSGTGSITGNLEHFINTYGIVNSTMQKMKGLFLKIENHGSVTNEFGGIDILLKNEAPVAPTEYGLRIRNENDVVYSRIADGIKFSNTTAGGNVGFNYLINGSGTVVGIADIALSKGATIWNDKTDRILIGSLIGIGTSASPADNAPTSGCVIYFNGTNLMAKNASGLTAQLNNVAFA